MKHIIPALVVVGTVAVLAAAAFLLYPHLAAQTGNPASSGTPGATSTPLSTLGPFGYRCGDGSEFTMVPSNDLSTVVVTPTMNAKQLPVVTMTKVQGTTTPIYSGGGILFAVHEGKVEVSTSSFHTECTPTDATPFTFGA